MGVEGSRHRSAKALGCGPGQGFLLAPPGQMNQGEPTWFGVNSEDHVIAALAMGKGGDRLPKSGIMT